MGVWHISGLGISPGALTAPTASIYLLLKASEEGDPDARKFFETSGERDQNDGRLRGFPEGFIIFTSKQVIETKISRRSEIKDRWFKNTGKDISVPKVACKFINDLHRAFFHEFDTPEIYYLAVDHQDFKKALPAIYFTVNALGTMGGKEIWANMVGGTNQINASILTAGTLSGAISRYYYFFEQDNDLLHPDLEKPKGKILKSHIDQVQSKWFQLPIFDLGWGDISNTISGLMDQYNNQIPLTILKDELNKIGLSSQYLAKLRGSKLIVIENNLAKPGAELNHLKNLLLSDARPPSNLSTWKKWAAEMGILWRQEPGQLCDLEKVSI